MTQTQFKHTELGPIPEHWEVRKMKFCFRERSQKGFPKEPLLAATQNHGVILKSNYENRTVEAIKGLESLKLVEIDDFVISLRSFQGGIERSYARGIISPAYTVLTPTHISAGYFRYLGKSPAFISLLKSTITGIREGQNIDYNKLKEYYLPLPPLSEQEAIVAYLDEQTGKIDQAIEREQKMIDLLNERKQIIIQQAVTKGLNPNAPLKHSCIDWIGQIPQHWEVRKTARLYSGIGSGTTPDSSNANYYTENGFNWLQTGDLNDGEIFATSKHITNRAIEEKSLRFYPIDSIVIAMYGATIGKVGVLKIETTTNQACCVLPPNERVNNSYMKFVYQAAKLELIRWSAGGGQPNISQGIIRNLMVPLPPIEEQREILNYLKKQLFSIDRAIEACEKLIFLLQERKQIIINEVVTGKIKVS